MGLNLDKPHKWKDDINKSVDMYNNWFMNFAPEVFRSTRVKTTFEVIASAEKTNFFGTITPEVLIENPNILPSLRMATCPPIAVDRLIGLSGVNGNLVKKMETEHKLPNRMSKIEIENELTKICDVIHRLLDKDIFPWLNDGNPINDHELKRASTIIADRLCGSVANPIIRNAQEQRQLSSIKNWLESHGYRQLPDHKKVIIEDLEPGTFTFRFNLPVMVHNQNGSVNIPINVVVKKKGSGKNDFPLLIEAKSAGDFTNVNKRRKEEAQKMFQLRSTYGDQVKFILFLCGYFDSGYLGYEAAEGIDWVWEHSIDDFIFFL